MKNLFIATAAFLFLISCNETTNEPAKTKEVTEVTSREYPSDISSVFEAHGGIDKWNEMNNLCFTIPKGDVEEVHTIDLKSRKTRIESKDYIVGFDGDKVWVQQDSAAFNTQRARFYHNLMFYFYAMPFVLGDEGITYSEAPALEMDGVEYPGTKVSFGSGVGDAPDDNYILYRDPKSNEMAWLAYTVTYKKDGPSERYSFIKYNKWQDVNGLKLPSELQWYKVEDGKPTEMRNAMEFTKTTVTETQLAPGLFKKPEGVEYAE